jgi:hypothetical protein
MLEVVGQVDGSHPTSTELALDSVPASQGGTEAF